MPFITKLGAVAARAYGWLASVAQAVVSSDAYFYLVSILLPGNGTNGATNNTFLDSSTNNFTVTRNGNTTQGTFSPFSQTGWSNYFDGSGDYLAIAPTSITISGDFTWEAWVYEQPINAYGTILGWRSGSTSWQGFLIQRDNGTNNLAANITQGGVVITQTSGTYIRNKWNHVALVRSGATITLYVNGFSAGATTYASSISPGTSCWIGSDPFNNVAAVQFSGWVSNCRFVNGTALYTATFTPSAVPLTAIANTLFLVCQSNRFVDNSANNFTITRNGDVAVTANSPFAPNNISPTSYSGLFDGSFDFLSVPDNTALDVEASNFTIECFIYLTTTPSLQYIFAKRATVGTYGGVNIVFLASTLAPSLYATVNGSSWGLVQTSTINCALNGWTHIAAVRNGTNWRLYVNGQIGVDATLSGTVPNSTDPFVIGTGATSGEGTLPGLISNFRVVKGTAVYTAAFTPPTAPLTAISGTSLLTCQNATFIDNSTNAFAITVHGNARPITTNPFQAPTPSPVSYSGQFDGTGDYLSAANNAAFDLGTGAFTIEAWVYISGNSTADSGGTRPATIFCAFPSSGSATGYNLLINGNASTTGTGVIFNNFVSGTQYQISVTATVAQNAWNHIAAVRSGTVTTIYLNGVSIGSGTLSNQNVNTGGNLIKIGGLEYAGYANELIGYISNLRVVKGTALYTANFIPSNTPLTAVSGTSLLTCQDNRFVDNSTNAFAITVNGDTRPVINSPFGYQTPISSTAYSGYFDGSGDYLNSAVSSGILPTTGTFTIEFWYYKINTGKRLLICGNANGSICIQDSGTTIDVSRYNVAFIQQPAYTNPLNTWVHLAVVRNGNTYTTYINGTSIGTTTDSNTLVDGTVFIGKNPGNTTEDLQGLISNLRVVKGTAVYTANFTPPTVPLTAISGTSLLTCQNSTFIDNSSNAFTITANGNATTTSVNPFGYSFPAAPTPVSYSALTNGGSGYFDGSGDYLSAASNAAFNFGSGDFTVEAWINTATVAAGQGMIVGRQDAGGGAVFQFRRDAAVVSLVLRNSAGGGLITVATGNVLNTNVWTHVAVVRSGTSIVIYVNGVSSATGTSSTSPDPAGARPLTIGALDDGVLSSYFTGFISNLRIVKGTAVYTSAFTPPPAPVTAITNTSLLLNYTNAGIADAASQNDLETSGGMQITTAQAKWGGTSMLFPSTAGSYLVTNSVPNLALGSGDFTVECWVYFATSAASKIVFDWRPSGTEGAYPTLYLNASSILTYYTSSADRIVSGSAMSVNTWVHIALVRSSGTTKLYVNGTQVGSNYTDSNNYLGTAGRPYIGGSSRTINDGLLNGYMNDFRITRYARYTANFTPPTAAFPTQ